MKRAPPPPCWLARIGNCAMIQFADAIIQYQLRQLAIGHFELFIIPSSRFAQVGQERIVNALRSELGAATIEVRLVDAIVPDPSSKLRAFVSQLAVDQSVR